MRTTRRSPSWRTLIDDAARCSRADRTTPKLSAANLGFHRGRRPLRRQLRCSAQVIDTLLDLYGPEQMEILRLYADRAHDHEEHVEILRAIQAHDPALASERMQRHLEGVRAVVAARASPSEQVAGERAQSNPTRRSGGSGRRTPSETSGARGDGE